MNKDEMYSIGQVEKVCKITKKALRYYDEKNILSPDLVCDENGYRYYSKESMLHVPVIKYYKQTGFKLEEMKGLLECSTYAMCEKTFRHKIAELEAQQEEIYLKHQSLTDWYQLVIEAQNVIENDYNDVCLKYINSSDMIYLEQEFDYDYMKSIINIDFTNHVHELNNAITGPVIIKYPSHKNKIGGKCEKIIIMQKNIVKTKDTDLMKFGGCMMATCYHIGPHENIDETYDKIYKWAEENGYKCDEESYERYVTDYWTIKNTNKFVTEVMIKVENLNCKRQNK